MLPKKIPHRAQRISSSGAAVDEVVCRTVIIAGLYENRKLMSYCSQVISREVFCHEYGKIPRHTGQNPITEGDLEWILTKLL